MKWCGSMSKNKLLRKFNSKNFAKSEKIRTFAQDEYVEPSALAIDTGRPIPTLTGESAIRFLERAKAVEEEAKRRMNEPPTLESLERELSFQKFFLEEDERRLLERKQKIEELEKKIEELNGEK